MFRLPGSVTRRECGIQRDGSRQTPGSQRLPLAELFRALVSLDQRCEGAQVLIPIVIGAVDQAQPQLAGPVVQTLRPGSHEGLRGRNVVEEDAPDQSMLPDRQELQARLALVVVLGADDDVPVEPLRLPVSGRSTR